MLAEQPRPLADVIPLDPSGDVGVLHPVVQPQCSLAVQLRRVTESVVGRPAELGAIRQELKAAETHLVALTMEGEPGIGKTRLLVAAVEMAEASGFVPVAVTTDEQIRGPFLLAQSIFASPALREAVAGTAAEHDLQRAVDAISGREERGLESLSSDSRLVRAYDLAAVALGAVASHTRLALLIDDLQWADDDSLRMLRYAIRADAESPIFVYLALRPDELATVNEAVTLLADMERMGLIRRLKLARFTQQETAELLRQVLAAPIDAQSAATMHAQSEGVPFIVEELARAYREAGMIQQIDDTWVLARNAGRLVPSAVRTLIQRRAGRLPEDTLGAMADASVLGRSFSVRDLAAIRQAVGGRGAESTAAELAEALTPAVVAGLLVEHGADEPADYTFTHEQVREFASAELPSARRRAMHGAVVDLLVGDGEPPPGSLALLARHALEAGDEARAAAFSRDAAQAALAANAPEEALRVVDQALASATASADRLMLLTARDDALAMLRRSNDRLEGLAELSALTEAVGDSHRELEVMLRRAAALRLAEDHDTAATLASRVRRLARERGDEEAELAACLELAQDLQHTALGESFSPTASEIDIDAVEEALTAACELAERREDDASLAAATRELGAMGSARIRLWFVGELQAGRGMAYMAEAMHESIEKVIPTLPIAGLFDQTRGYLERALELYERLGDRRGVMSTVITMAYLSYAPEIHLTSSARYIEEIRRVSDRMFGLVRESERALAEMQMEYGVHVYARAKVVPDLALSRGEQAYRSAKVLGDRGIEFRSAGGLAMTHLEMGELEEAATWLDRASTAALAAPTPGRARQLEMWRGMARAAAGDAEAMQTHLERAVKMATDAGRPAARCEALARLALEAARLGAASEDPDLLQVAEQAAFDAKDAVTLLPGHPPWGAQADAALAQVALARSDVERAVMAGAAAAAWFEEAHHEDLELDILLGAAPAILSVGEGEGPDQVRAYLQLVLSGIAQRTLDEDVRVRWLRGPLGRRLADLAGPLDLPQWTGHAAGDERASDLASDDAHLLHLLTEGKTNKEIADELGCPEDEVGRRLGEVFARIGASSRAEATSFAFRERL